ncbi:MAG: ankyrin repeat domain-containing protein [Steroidobacteraceae bacterium]
MNPNDNPQDDELLARYRQASADAPSPSDAVRAAILAESRRAAAELAKQAPQPVIDVSRPAANDSRWKITAFGTAGAALLAALLFAPRYWESAPPAQVSMAPPPAPLAPPSFAQNYAPVSPRASPLAARPPTPTARSGLSEPSAPAAESGARFMSADRAARADSAPKPATLESAVAQGDLAQAASLLDQGAVIDARDEAGRTPLMLAVTEDKLEIVRLLLARGADPNAADNAGHTPIQQATKRNLQDVAALLEQAGAR